MNAQHTLYCGRRHRRADGIPIAHPCRVLAPEFLRAERCEEYGLAAAVLEEMALVLHAGIPDTPESPELGRDGEAPRAGR